MMILARGYSNFLVKYSNIQENAISHVDDGVRRLEGGLAHDLCLQGDELLRDLLKVLVVRK